MFGIGLADVQAELRCRQAHGALRLKLITLTPDLGCDEFYSCEVVFRAPVAAVGDASLNFLMRLK